MQKRNVEFEVSGDDVNSQQEQEQEASPVPTKSGIVAFVLQQIHGDVTDYK